MNRAIIIATSLVTCLVVVAAGDAHHAQAQDDDDVATARRLFKEARTLMKADDFEAASEKLERALQLDISPGYVLNLAVCLEELGKLGSAWLRYQKAEKLANEKGSDRQRDFARERAEAISAQVPRLRVTGPPEAADGAVQIQLDGQPLPRATLEGAIPVDPGTHEVSARAAGYISFEKTIDIVESGIVDIEIPPLAPVAPPARRPSKTRRFLNIGLTAAGGALVATGLGFGWSAKDRWDEAFASGACDSQTLLCTPAGQAQTDSVRRRGLVANILVGAGAGALVAGIVLMVTAPKGEKRPGATARSVISPGPFGPGAFGLTVQRRF